MPKNMLIIAEHQNKRLLKEFDSHSRLPIGLKAKTEGTIDNYKFVIHELLKEINLLNEKLGQKQEKNG